MNRPVPATLGGFTIGFASGLLGGALPTGQSQYIDSFIFVAVIVVLLVRPERALHAPAKTWSACEAARRPADSSSARPCSCVAAALLGTTRLALDAGRTSSTRS